MEFVRFVLVSAGVFSCNDMGVRKHCAMKIRQEELLKETKTHNKLALLLKYEANYLFIKMSRKFNTNSINNGR